MGQNDLRRDLRRRPVPRRVLRPVGQIPGKGSVQVLHQSRQRCSVRFQQYRRLSLLQIRQTRLNRQLLFLQDRWRELFLQKIIFYLQDLPSAASFRCIAAKKQGKPTFSEGAFPFPYTYPISFNNASTKNALLKNQHHSPTLLLQAIS